MTRVVSCERCRHKDIKLGNDILEVQTVCNKGLRDFSDIKDENYDEELKKQIECEEFKSRYIEYPIEVSEIIQPTGGGIRTETYSAKCGQLVKVRPCGEKYGDKTYLGIFLGDADIGLFISHHPDTKALNLTRHYNPAIFVPELKEIVYGAGSWWGKIKSEDELKEISDDDIANVWYVKLLKGE